MPFLALIGTLFFWLLAFAYSAVLALALFAALCGVYIALHLEKVNPYGDDNA